uniref:Terminal protein LMP2A n=2 Tax=Epstein-Barr virus (strain GD1) TaxID=10376 RepID=A0A191T702_EBVG|nr:terminal protein LMP2A [human gammaherpesvirus 4]
MGSLEMVPMGAGPPSPGGDPDGDDGGNNSQYPSASGSSGNTPTPPNDEERESNEEPPPPYEDPYWGNGDRHSDYQPLGTQDQSLYLGLQHDGNDGLPPPPYSPRDDSSQHIYEEAGRGSMNPVCLPVIVAPYLFWLAAIAASCFTASVSTVVSATGLALSLLLLAAVANSSAAAQRKLLTPVTVLTAVVTFFAICLTWRIEDPPFNSILFALLAAAGGLQGIYVLVMLVLLILAYRRRWRRLTVCGGMMFLACLVVLIVDAVLQLSPLLGAVTVVSMTLLLLAFVLWLSSPGGLGTLGAALLTLAAALALLASLILGTLNLTTMFLLMLLWTLVVLLICSSCSSCPLSKVLLARLFLYALALLLLASALTAGGSILPTNFKSLSSSEFIPHLFCMLLLIVAGILFILAILTEWGSGNRTYGPVFMSLGGLLTMVAGAVWLTVMTNTLLSAWILTAGFLIFLIGFALFGVIRCCRYCCYYCLTLESEERPPTPYRNTV